MNDSEIQRIYRLSVDKINKVQTHLKRYCFDAVNWNDRLIALKGARGVGKTTLLLQKIRESGLEARQTLYVSLDSVWLDAKDIWLLAEYHAQHGGTRLVLDEVHYLQDWQRLIKNIYDDFPDLKVAYTGSSMLRVKARQGDLSRRQVDYELFGLSFREFLHFEGVLDYSPLSLEEILENHLEVAREVQSKIKVLPLFERYLRSGYYPFYRESLSKYGERICAIVNQTLDSDWPSVEEVTSATIRRTRKMLKILAARPPQTPKMTILYNELGTERQHGLKMLYVLERAGLLRLLSSERENLKNLTTPEKIYCDNTNLMHAIVPQPDIGMARETFFANQLAAGHRLAYPRKGDFLVDDKWLFEVGGSGKGFDQIADEPNSYVVNDGVEVGVGNRIPLWVMGFLY